MVTAWQAHGKSTASTVARAWCVGGRRGHACVRAGAGRVGILPTTSGLRCKQPAYSSRLTTYNVHLTTYTLHSRRRSRWLLQASTSPASEAASETASDTAVGALWKRMEERVQDGWLRWWSIQSWCGYGASDCRAGGRWVSGISCYF